MSSGGVLRMRVRQQSIYSIISNSRSTKKEMDRGSTYVEMKRFKRTARIQVTLAVKHYEFGNLTVTYTSTSLILTPELSYQVVLLPMKFDVQHFTMSPILPFDILGENKDSKELALVSHSFKFLQIYSKHLFVATFIFKEGIC